MNFRKRLDDSTPYLLILPVVIFLFVFAILPIAQSLRFAFYDYQLNDQRKNDLYSNPSYNLRLHDETIKYLHFYLDSESVSVEKEETTQAIAALKKRLTSYDEEVKQLVPSPQMQPVVEVSEEVLEKIEAGKQDLIKELNQLYTIEDAFTLEEDIHAVAGGFDESVVQPNFTPTENFEEMVRDRRVRSTMRFTLIFTFISVFLELILGIALAMIMNQAIKGRGLIRTTSLIPWAIPTSVAAMMWGYLYDGSAGIVAHLFSSIGLLSKPTDLLLKSGSTLWAIVAADVWKTTPYMALLLLAGLQTIPDTLYESSSLDGANKWEQFRHITLPLLKPSIFVALLFRTLDAFRVFDLIYVLTGGGPGGSTESISIYAYKIMFGQTRFGYGSAIVLTMAIVVGIITFVYIKSLNVKLMGGDGS